ncbi:hypothetical protein B0H63DRAFT_472220 [Podospora didyma]|uniref:Uncharacterized protein n=1 Tax=Podospora didyma TaxID=330526 RepID=A0AAE0TZ96_9PEZI|nr:hypothetical protein B0H63DRAFT_472220 [Podospora didyma]
MVLLLRVFLPIVCRRTYSHRLRLGFYFRTLGNFHSKLSAGHQAARSNLNPRPRLSEPPKRKVQEKERQKEIR